MATRKPPVAEWPWECPLCDTAGSGGHAGWVTHYLSGHASEFHTPTAGRG